MPRDQPLIPGKPQLLGKMCIYRHVPPVTKIFLYLVFISCYIFKIALSINKYINIKTVLYFLLQLSTHIFYVDAYTRSIQ